MFTRMASCVALAVAAAWPGFVMAGKADVESAELDRGGDGTYTVRVTVSHADEGWDHYADAWQVLAPDGTVLGTRELAHPHVNEQPFTRALRGVAIPDDLEEVRIRARDKVHGFGGREIRIPVAR